MDFCTKNRSSRLLSLVATAAVGALAATSLTAQASISYSRHDFGNAYRQNIEVAYPNATSSAGSTAGDMLWKVWPPEVASRAATWRISGVRFSFRVDRSYSGAFPQFLSLPRIAFFPLVEQTIRGAQYLVPDVTRPFPTSFQLPGYKAVEAGVQSFELQLGPKNPDPRLQKVLVLPGRNSAGAVQGWAVALLAPQGARLGNGQANFAAVPTFGEVHRDGSRRAYSGVYDAKAKEMKPFGTRGVPSNLGELAIELYFDQPTLQVFSDGSGGVRDDRLKIETHKGPGAYDNGLATAIKQGFFGLYTQYAGNDGLVAFPIVVSDSAAPPTQTLRFNQVDFLFNPAGLSLATLFSGAGIYGSLAKYKAGGAVGHRQDQASVWHSGRIPFMKDKSLSGLSFWVQTLLFDAKKNTSCAETNAVRLRF